MTEETVTYEAIDDLWSKIYELQKRITELEAKQKTNEMIESTNKRLLK